MVFYFLITMGLCIFSLILINTIPERKIEMQGNSTYIADPAEPKSEPRKFAFDFSYWSHDGFKEEPNGYLSPVSPQYADQVKLCTVYDFKLFLCQFFLYKNFIIGNVFFSMAYL